MGGQTSLRVATFNILHGQRAADGVVDVRLLGSVCSSFEADVLALQEVDVGVPRSGRVHEARAVAAACGMKAVFGKAARVGGIGEYGNAVLVRGSVVGSRVVRLPRTAPNRPEPRCAVAVSTDLGVTVVATHLSIHRPEVFDQLEAVCGLVSEVGGPVVVLGDFNLEPPDVVARLESVGLSVAVSGPTFPASSPRIRIDYVAVGGGLSFGGSAEVVETPCSDHRAVVVEVFSPVTQN